MGVSAASGVGVLVSGEGTNLQALIDAGLTIRHVGEHEFCAWQHVKAMVKGDDGWWRLPPGMPEMPLLFSLRARLPEP